MRKTLAIVLMLALLLTLNIGVHVHAEEKVRFDTEPGGFRITVPDEVKNAAGTVEFFPSVTFSIDKEIYITVFNYVAMTPEEYDVLQNSYADPSLTEEAMLRLNDQYIAANSDLFTVTASATPELAEFYEKTMHDRGYRPERIRLGEADGFVFDLYDFSPESKENRDAWKAPFTEDFTRVHAALKEALTRAELFAPDTSDPFMGMQISFETKDLDGNPVKSEDLFKQNKITMLNLWATWCEPCKSELKELGEMNSRLQEQNCAVVGMLYDSAEEGAVEEGKALLSENQADYLNLMFPEGFEEKLGVDLHFPTSLMVDSNGTVWGSITGAYVETYEPMIELLLDDGLEPADAVDAAAAPVFDTEAGGLLLPVPDGLDDTVGRFDLLTSNELGGLYPDVYLTSFEYIGMTEDELRAWNDEIDAGIASGEITPEDVFTLYEPIEQLTLSPLTVLAAPSRELEEAYYNGIVVPNGEHPKRVLIAEQDGYLFYLYDFTEDNERKLSAMSPAYVEEYRRIEAAMKEALTNAEFFAPPVSDAKALEGTRLSFETTDLDGNPVRSEDLFKQNDITMLNIWATWCGPCISELHELGVINGRLKDQNCSVVGLLYDAEEDGAIKEGKALIADNHADYLNLMPPKGFDDMVNITAFPTSLMVDSSGTVVACIIGNNIAAYEPVIQKLLAEKTAPAA